MKPTPHALEIAADCAPSIEGMMREVGEPPLSEKQMQVVVYMLAVAISAAGVAINKVKEQSQS